jgi:hypothetical protein
MGCSLSATSVSHSVSRNSLRRWLCPQGLVKTERKPSLRVFSADLFRVWRDDDVDLQRPYAMVSEY